MMEATIRQSMKIVSREELEDIFIFLTLTKLGKERAEEATNRILEFSKEGQMLIMATMLGMVSKR